MGQRSQIYVRINADKKVLVARYFGWNYGERMISRSRYTIEWLKEHSRYGIKTLIINEYIKKLIHIIETNFDMKDVVLSTDIIKKYNDYCKDDCVEFNDYVFKQQDNNDGKLLIDVCENEIKYAFLDCTASHDLIMDGEAYMKWNSENWENSPYITKRAKNACKRNIRYIEKHAKLMIKDEVEEFLNCKYQTI